MAGIHVLPLCPHSADQITHLWADLAAAQEHGVDLGSRAAHIQASGETLLAMSESWSGHSAGSDRSWPCSACRIHARRPCCSGCSSRWRSWPTPLSAFQPALNASHPRRNVTEDPDSRGDQFHPMKLIRGDAMQVASEEG
jgi:hypothetical protein